MSESILGKFTEVKQIGNSKRRWKALCPAHNDTNPSLSITKGDRAWLIKCWSGCDIKDICDAVGLRVQHLWFDGSKPSQMDRKQQEHLELQRTIIFIHENSINPLTEADKAEYKRAKRILGE